MIAGSGKFCSTRGPATDEKGFGKGSVCVEVDSGSGSAERMTVSRGQRGPRVVTADEASKYAGIATIPSMIFARNESGVCR